MAQITLKGKPIHTLGNLPVVGSKAPDFKLVKSDLSELTLHDFQGKQIILNIFPSLDTSTCATSVRHFNAKAEKLENTAVICISKDLPFAHNRFCATEGLKNVLTASEYRDNNFSDAYQLRITDGPLWGLHSRCVIVIDEKQIIKYTEQVPEITQEPNYDAALAILK